MAGVVKKFLIAVSLVLVSSMAFAASPTIDISDKQASVSNHFINNIVNLNDVAGDAEDADNLLSFSVLSQSNSALNCFVDLENGIHYLDCEVVNRGSSGISNVQVQVRDTAGNTASDYFALNFSDTGSGSSSGICGDIDLITNTIHIGEDSVEEFSFRINNLSNRDFDIDQVLFDEESQYLSIDNDDISFEDDLPEDSDVEVSFTVESFNVSDSKDVFVTVRIKGQFDNGTQCHLEDNFETFRIFVEEENDIGSNSDDSFCKDIIIDDERIKLDEDDLETVEINVSNENSRDFDIDFVTVLENDSDLKANMSHVPNEIEGGSEETVRVRFETEKVSDDQLATLTLRISGTFSNGKNCPSTSISEQIHVEIQNGNSSLDNDGDETDDIDLSFNPSALQLTAGESKFVTAKIENNTLSRKCVDLDFFVSNSFLQAELMENETCISARNDETVNLKITALQGIAAGTYSGRLEADLGLRSATRTLTVRVALQSLPQEQGSLELVSYPSIILLTQTDQAFAAFTLSNSSNAPLTNVSVEMENLPAGVFFEPKYILRLDKGQITTVNSKIQTNDAQAKEINAMLRVSFDGKTVLKPVKIIVSSDASNDGGNFASGLVPLARTVGVGVGLLAVLAAIVIIIYFIVRR